MGIQIALSIAKRRAGVVVPHRDTKPATEGWLNKKPRKVTVCRQAL